MIKVQMLYLWKREQEERREGGCEREREFRSQEWKWMTKEKGGGGEEGVNVMSDKSTTGRVKVRKDSCITQKCTGIAISLGFMSCKEMGRDRKPWLRGREVVLHYYLEGSSFSASTFTSSLPFLPPTQRCYLWLICILLKRASFMFFVDKANSATRRKKEENLCRDSITTLLIEIPLTQKIADGALPVFPVSEEQWKISIFLMRNEQIEKAAIILVI